MKKLIIDYEDLIIKVNASEDNTTILDSYRISSPSDMKSILIRIIIRTPETYAIHKRGVRGMIREWRVHNMLYSLGILKNRVKDVDLNIGQPWYIKTMYFVLSPFYLHFK